MRIAVIIERMRPYAGGNERSTWQIATRLARRGHDVTILCHEASSNIALPERLQITQAGGPSPRGAVGLLHLRRWALRQLDAGRYDTSLSVTSAIPGHVLQPRGGTVRETLKQNVARKTSLTSRMVKQLALASNTKQRTLLACERLTVNSPRVRRFAAVSRYVIDQLVEHYTIMPRRIVRIPNAVSIESATPQQATETRNTLRENLQIEADQTVFLFPAMNAALKGWNELLDALQRVVRQNPLVMVIAAMPVRYRTQQAIGEMGLTDHVCYIGTTKNIDALYHACDLTVLPTWYDPSSKVVLESLAHGKPAISTRFNGASDWILNPSGDARPQIHPHDAPGGAVIDSPSDIDALAEVMIRLCDPQRRERCHAALQSLDPRLNMDRHVDTLEALLREVAD